MRSLFYRGAVHIAPLFFLFISLSWEAIASECSQEKIRYRIDQIIDDENFTKRWEAIDKAITPSVKECIFSRMAKKYKFQIIDGRKIKFKGNIFKRVSASFFDAPASDHGWATVFQKKMNKYSEEYYLMKIAFSVSPTGDLDLIDLFSIEKKEGEIYFSLIDDKGKITYPGECMGCHVIREKEGYIFGKYNLDEHED